MLDRRASSNGLRRPASKQAGLTLLELIITCAILMILASAAMPVARFTVKRRKEAELRADLREMRDAIDRYKDAADRNLIRVEAGTEGYPPDLQTLVMGVDVTAQPGAGLGSALAGAVSGQSGSASTPFGSSTPNFGSSFGSSAFGSSSFGSSSSSFGSSLGSSSSAFGAASGSSTGTAAGTSANTAGKPLIQHVRFLRRIPVDPMTGKTDWGLRSVADDPSSTSWGGMDVFDVFSLSTDMAIDGTRYQDW